MLLASPFSVYFTLIVEFLNLHVQDYFSIELF